MMQPASFDAILVPGGGVRERGELPLWVQKRLEFAANLQTDEYVITLSAGTTHKPPPLDQEGFPIFESVAAARYLIKCGVDANKVLFETSSYDTIGNAYFSRVIHIDPLSLKKLLIITSDFHMPRTERIFRWIYNLNPPTAGYDLHFTSVPDNEIDSNLLNIRKIKEEEGVKQLLQTIEQVHSLQELHEWLFKQHTAYSVEPYRTTITGQVSETY